MDEAIMIKRAMQKELQRLNLLYAEYSEKNVTDDEDVGTLYVRKKSGGKQYLAKYYVDGKRKSKYLGKNTDETVIKLKASQIHAIRLERIKNNREILSKALHRWKSLGLRDVEEALSPAYTDIPLDAETLMDQDDRLAQLRIWAHANYEKNPDPFPEQIILAIDGRRVRSRGECLIYNLLYALGIPFRYDAVISSKNQFGEMERVSPDFLIKCFDGRLIIIEHMGMLSKDSYAEKNKRKVQLYLRNGYTQCDNLFITSDTFNGGINTQSIARILGHIADIFYGLDGESWGLLGKHYYPSEED